MPSMNKVMIMGHLGQDPEMRYMPDGGAVATISVASTMKWKDKQTGEPKEETEWHRVVLRARLAEIAGEYLKKGNPVFVEGRIRTRSFEAKNGEKKYVTEIVAQGMQLLGGRQESSEPSSSAGGEKQGSTKQQPKQRTGGKFDDMEDDIPF